MSSQVSQIVQQPKSNEGRLMPFRKPPSMDRTGIEDMAEGWGKNVARRVPEDVGADLDLDADDIEQMAATAARAVARGTIAELLARKAVAGVAAPSATAPTGPTAAGAFPKAGSAAHVAAGGPSTDRRLAPPRGCQGRAIA